MNSSKTRLNPAKLAATPKPIGPNIGAGAEKLYKLEERRTAIIKLCVEEQMKVMDIPKEEYWTRGVPEALLSVLEAWERVAAARAAQKFLEQYGFTVTEPKSELQAVS